MGAFMRSLLSQGGMAQGKRTIERHGQGAFRLGGEVAGAQRNRDGRAGGRDFTRQPVERAGLAGAGRGEQAEGEGRRRVRAAQKLGQAFLHSLRLGREGRLVGRRRGVGLKSRDAGRGGSGRRCRRDES
jgi:hypothetical protein